MPKRAIAARVLPILAVAAVLALSFVTAGKVPFSGKLVACVGYGYGYGYVASPPTVINVNPNAGPSSGGTTVTITGLGYCSPATAVDFGTTPAASFVINSDTSITAVSPVHAAGTVDVTVTNAQGTSAATALDHFTFAAFTSYFQWFDKASAGFLNDNIHLVNEGSAPANITVTGPGGAQVSVSNLAVGAETYVTFPSGTIGGPVVVNSDQFVLASQRVQYNQSFNEIWSADSFSAAATSYINWYDKASDGFLNDNIHLLNPFNAPSSVSVTVSGIIRTAVVQPQSSTYVNFPQGTIGGPVKIQVTAGANILASQRVQFRSTFNEVWAHDASFAAQTSIINWFDKASTGFLNDNIHLLNPGVTTANVTVSEDGGVVSSTVNVAAGAETYVTFPQGTIGGPVKVVVNSGPNVLSSQRVQYNDSFNEVWSEDPLGFASTFNVINWYDKASAGFVADNIHLFNPGTVSAVVTVDIGGGSTLATVIVPADGETYVTLPQGTIGGPVNITVTSGPGILAAGRTQFNASFNEIWAQPL